MASDDAKQIDNVELTPEETLERDEEILKHIQHRYDEEERRFNLLIQK